MCIRDRFSTVPGVKEDVTELILNLKCLAVKMYCDTPKQVTIDAQGPCEAVSYTHLSRQRASKLLSHRRISKSWI